MDQMIEATFIHWYNWSYCIGQVFSVYISVGVLEYYSRCTIKLNYTSHQNFYDSIHPYYFTIASTVVFILTTLQLVCACVGLCLLVYYKKHLNIDRTGENLLKLIYEIFLETHLS